MKDKQLYEQILGLAKPWVIKDVELEMTERRVVLQGTQERHAYGLSSMWSTHPDL